MRSSNQHRGAWHPTTLLDRRVGGASASSRRSTFVALQPVSVAHAQEPPPVTEEPRSRLRTTPAGTATGTGSRPRGRRARHADRGRLHAGPDYRAVRGEARRPREPEPPGHQLHVAARHRLPGHVHAGGLRAGRDRLLPREERPARHDDQLHGLRPGHARVLLPWDSPSRSAASGRSASATSAALRRSTASGRSTSAASTGASSAIRASS